MKKLLLLVLLALTLTAQASWPKKNEYGVISSVQVAHSSGHAGIVKIQTEDGYAVYAVYDLETHERLAVFTELEGAKAFLSYLGGQSAQ